MCQIDRFVFCPVLCALMLCAAAEESRPPESDPYKNPEAWMNSPSRRRPDPGRPMSPEMRAVNPYDVDKLKEEDLAKMSLGDPLLKYAYVEVFTRSMNHLHQMGAQQELALADMRRRGESVSPMLLKLIEENQETRIESSVLGHIGDLGTVRLEPFLEYARKLLRERTQSTVVAYASGLLASHGTKEDVELLEWLLKQQPFAVTDATDSLKALRERLNPPQPEIRPERRNGITHRETTPGNAANGTQGVSTPKRGGESTATRWFAWVGLVTVVVGALLILVKKGIKRGR